MADEASESDPLARMQKPFLALLGFVWLLTLGLLMFHLNSQEWGGLDGNSLILLGILLGIALLPFVSQFSVAGLFEFKREISQLSDKVDAVRNEVASIAAASASAQQQTTASPTQKVYVNTPAAEDVASRVAETISDPEHITSTTDAESPVSITTIWSEAWEATKFLLALYFLRVDAAERGTEAIPNYDMPFKRLQQRGIDTFLTDESRTLATRQLLTDSLETGRLIAQKGEAADVDLSSALLKLTRLKANLFGQLSVFVTLGAAAFFRLRADEASGRAIMQDIYRKIDESDESIDGSEH